MDPTRNNPISRDGRLDVAELARLADLVQERIQIPSGGTLFQTERAVAVGFDDVLTQVNADAPTIINSFVTNITNIVRNFVTNLTRTTNVTNLTQIQQTTLYQITQLTQIFQTFTTVLQQINQIITNVTNISVTQLTQILQTITNIFNQFTTIILPPNRVGCDLTISYIKDVLCVNSNLIVTRATLNFLNGVIVCGDLCGQCKLLPPSWEFSVVGVEDPGGCPGCVVANNAWTVTYDGAGTCTWSSARFTMCGEADGQWQLSFNAIDDQWELRLLDYGADGPPPSCCVNEACGACAAGTLPGNFRLLMPGPLNEPCCSLLAGDWTLTYVGNCTWQTDEVLDLTPCGGLVGQAWRLAFEAGSWHLYAAGTDIGTPGVLGPDGCAGGIIFQTIGWPLAGGGRCERQAVNQQLFLITAVLTPLCVCPDTTIPPGAGDLLWVIPRAAFDCCGANVLTPQGQSTKCVASSPIEIRPAGECTTLGLTSPTTTTSEGCCACAGVPPVTGGESVCPGCASCPVKLPRQWVFTVAGLVGGGSFCAGCDGLNGTWILTYDDTIQGPCFWFSDAVVLDCAGTTTPVRWVLNPDPDGFWHLVYQEMNGRWIIPWADFDCCGPNDLVLNFPGADSLCDDGAATVTITIHPVGDCSGDCP